MANRYWVGGTGTWNASSTTNWSASSGGSSGASVPTAADSVFFDQAGTYTVTMTGAITCLDFTVSSGTVTFTSTGTPTISGSVSLVTGTVWSGTGLITFNATTTGKTITTNGTTISGAITFNGLGGEWTLGSALTTVSSVTTTLTAGSIVLNGFTLSTGIFSSSNINTRNISFGTGNIVLTTTTAASTVLLMTTATNFTYSGTGGFTTDASVTRTLSFGTTGGSSTNSPNVTFTGSGAAVQTLNTGSWFNKLDFGTTAFVLGTTSINVNALTLSSGGTFTGLTVTMVGTGTITTNSKTVAAFTVNSSGTTTFAGSLTCTTYTQTSGDVNFSTASLTCSGTATYTSGTLSNVGTISCTTWTCAGTFTMTNGTITPSTSFVVTGGFNYNAGTLSAVPTFTHTSGTVTLGQAYALTATGTYTLTAGTLTLSGFNLSTGIFASTGSGVRSIAFGTGNIILTHSTAATVVLSMSNSLNFTYTGTGGFTSDASIARTFTFGVSNGSSAIAPNLTFTGSGTAIHVLTTSSWFGALNFGTTAFAIGTTNLNLNSLTLSTGGTFTTLTATMVGTGSITSNGNTTLGPLVINSTSGTTTLTSALSCTTYTQTSGDVNFATFNLTCSGAATYTSGTLNNIGTISCTTWTCAGTFTLTQGTITPSTSFVVSGSFNFNGGTLTAVPQFTQTGTSVVTLGKALTLAVTGTYTLTAGTLNLNGFDLTTGIFSSTNSNIRSIAFGSNNIILATTTASQVNLSMATATNFTWTGTGGFTAAADIARTFGFGQTSGGTTSNAPNLTFTGSGTVAPTLTTTGYFNKLDFGTTAFAIGTTNLNLNSLTLSTGGTFTTLTATMVGTGSIVNNGKSIGPLIIDNVTGTTTLTSALSCTTFAQNSGTIDFASFNLTCSGAATYTSGTLNNIGTISCTIWNCNGAFTLTQGTITPSASVGVIGGFTYSGGTLSPTPAINQASGTVTLGKAYALTATGVYTLTSGTLDLGGFNLTTGTFVSNTSNARNIVFGSNNIILATTTASQVNLQMGTATGFSWTGTGGFTADASIARTFSVGTTVAATSSTAPNLTFTGSGSAVPVLTSGSWFNKLDFGSTAFIVGTSLNLNSVILSTGGTFTSLSLNMVGTGSITSNGKSIASLTVDNVSGITTFIDQPTLSAAATTTTTLTSGTLNLSGFDLTTGIFSSNNTNTRSIIFGSNNIILTYSTAATVCLDMANATGFSWTGTGGFTTQADITRTLTFGTTAGSSTNSPNLTLTGSGTALISFTSTSWFNKLDFGNTAFAVPATNLNVNILTLSSGGTFTALSPTLTTTQTWTPQFSKQLAGMGFNAVGGTLTFGSTQSFVATAIFTLTAGTLNLNGFDLTIGIFSSTGTGVRSIAFGSNNIILSTTTAAQVNLSMANATNFTWTGTGGFTAAASVTRTFTFGTTSSSGTSTNAPSLTLTGSGTSVLTFTSGSWFNKLDFGSTTFTIATTTLNTNSLTLSTGGTFTGLTASMIGTGTIITNGKTIAAFTVNCPGGTTTLGGALTIPTTATTILTSGTLDLSGFTLSTGIFSSTNSNTRSLAFGSANVVLTTATAASTNLDMANATGFSWTGTGGFTVPLDITRTFAFGSTGGSATNAPNLSLTSGAAVPTLTTGSWFNTLDFTGTTSTPAATNINVSTLVLATGGTYSALIPIFTRTQTWTAQFSKQLGGIGVNGPGITLTLENTQTYTATSICYVTQGTLDLGGYNFTIGTFSSNNSNTRSVAFGSNNIILATTTASSVNLDMANATGFSWTGTGGFTVAADITRTFTVGTTSGSSTSSPNLTFTGAGTAIPTLTTGSYFNKLDFGSTAFTLAATSLNVNGITLSTGGTFTNLSVTTVGTGNVTTNGKTIAAFTVNCPGGITALVGALTLPSSADTTLTSGTLDLLGYTLTTGTFISTNTNTRSVAFGSGNISLISTTAAQVNLSMANATNFTWTGTGGFTAAASVTRTFTFGTTGGSSTNSPNVTLTGTGVSIQTFTSNSWFNILNFGSTAFNVGTTTLNCNNLILSTGGTFTGVSTNFVGTGTFTPNGKTTAALTINSTSGTTTLSGAVSCTTYAQTSGDVNFATFNLTCSGAATYTSGALINTGTISCTTWTCAGTFTMTNGTITPSTSFVVTGAFNYNGGTLSAVPTFTHTSGTVTLGQSYALTATGVYTLTSGTLDLGGTFTLSTGTFVSNNANTRNIYFGSGNITLTTTTAGAVNVSMANATNVTISASTGGFTAAASVTRTFTFGTTGGLPVQCPNITLTGTGTSIQTFTTGSYFNKLDFGSTAFVLGTTSLNLNSLTLSTGGTFTNLTVNIGGAGTITPNGKTIANLFIDAYFDTTTLAGALTVGTTGTTTLNTGILDLSGFTLTTGVFSSTATAGALSRSIAFGTGSIALTFATNGADILIMDDATYFTYTGTPTFTCAAGSPKAFYFGNVAGGSATNAPNLSITSGAGAPIIASNSWFKLLNFTGTTSTPTATVVNVDTLTLATGGTYTAFTPVFTRTQTWTPQFSKQLGGIGVNGPGVTLTLDNTQTYATGSTLYVNGGTLNLNSTSQTFGYFASSVSGSRSITGGGSITIGNDWTVTDGSGFTGSGYTITMNKSTSKVFAGGGGQYGTLVQSGLGALSITGSNRFTDIQVA